MSGGKFMIDGVAYDGMGKMFVASVSCEICIDMGNCMVEMGLTRNLCIIPVTESLSIFICSLSGYFGSRKD